MESIIANDSQVYLHLIIFIIFLSSQQNHSSSSTFPSYLRCSSIPSTQFFRASFCKRTSESTKIHSISLGVASFKFHRSAMTSSMVNLARNSPILIIFIRFVQNYSRTPFLVLTFPLVVCVGVFVLVQVCVQSS